MLSPLLPKNPEDFREEPLSHLFELDTRYQNTKQAGLDQLLAQTHPKKSFSETSSAAIQSSTNGSGYHWRRETAAATDTDILTTNTATEHHQSSACVCVWVMMLSLVSVLTNNPIFSAVFR